MSMKKRPSAQIQPLPRTGTPSLSLVIPLFNEERVFPELKAALLSLTSKLRCSKIEILFVNDGSSDSTANQVLDWAKADARVKMIDFARNFGHQIAITAGIDYAQGDAVVVMDGDLQDPPELIHLMLERYMEGFDVVYAQRTVRHGETWFKKFTASVFYRVMKRFVHRDLPENVGDFRLMSREATNAFLGLREGQRFVRGLMTWVGFAQIAVPFERPPRRQGETKFPFRKMIAFAWDAILSFSNAPLRLGLVLGSATLLFGGGYTCYAVFLRFVVKNTVPGWTSLVVLISFIGGAILMCLGFIGEYVGRIYIELKQRPLYIVRRTTNLSSPLKLSRAIHAETERRKTLENVPYAA